MLNKLHIVSALKALYWPQECNYFCLGGYVVESFFRQQETRFLEVSCWGTETGFLLWISKLSVFSEQEIRFVEVTCGGTETGFLQITFATNQQIL